MKILDKLNREIITVMIIAGLLFTAVFIALTFLIELEDRTRGESGEEIVTTGSNTTQQVLDGTW
jgi:phosphotransferase system  glucose/maltose/N-acetylglucosamine-specific IIC component